MKSEFSLCFKYSKTTADLRDVKAMNSCEVFFELGYSGEKHFQGAFDNLKWQQNLMMLMEPLIMAETLKRAIEEMVSFKKQSSVIRLP
jgi:hypothetical protein